jgi:NUMOD4 motif
MVRLDWQYSDCVSEQWRPVRGYEDAYEVSDLGHVRSVTRVVRGRERSDREIQGKLLTPRIRPDGTYAINLWIENKYKQVPVRRIVLEAFDRPKPANCDAANVNEDPSDNRLRNLQWRPDKRFRGMLGR